MLETQKVAAFYSKQIPEIPTQLLLNPKNLNNLLPK